MSIAKTLITQEIKKYKRGASHRVVENKRLQAITDDEENEDDHSNTIKANKDQIELFSKAVKELEIDLNKL